MARFDGQHILVVGATGALGSSIARALYRQGARLVLTGRNDEKLSALAGECGASSLLLNLTNAEQLNQVIDAIEPVDGLVYAAGIAPLAPVKYLKKDAIEECFALNSAAPLLLVRELLKRKKLNRGASVVWLSSLAAGCGAAGYSLYSASKAALEGAARSLALELAPKGQRVNCVAPGMIQSEMADDAAEQISDDAMEAHLKAYPLGLGRAEDVANAVSFLLSAESKWITGVTLPVDGGFSIR